MFSNLIIKIIIKKNPEKPTTQPNAEKPPPKCQGIGTTETRTWSQGNTQSPVNSQHLLPPEVKSTVLLMHPSQPDHPLDSAHGVLWRFQTSRLLHSSSKSAPRASKPLIRLYHRFSLSKTNLKEGGFALPPASEVVTHCCYLYCCGSKEKLGIKAGSF